MIRTVLSNSSKLVHRGLPRCILTQLCRRIHTHVGQTPKHFSTQLIQQSIRTASTVPESSTNDVVSEVYDIVIVGGGLVGSALACALSSVPYGKNLRILLLDAGKPPVPASTYEPVKDASHSPMPTLRTVALSSQSADLLRSIGVWDTLLATGRVGPYSEMIVEDAFLSDTAQVGWNIHDQSVFGDTYVRGLDQLNNNNTSATGPNAQQGDALGYLTENDVLVSILGDKLQSLQSDTFTAQYNVKITNVDTATDPSCARITTSTGNTIQCKLVIGADGANSPVKQYTGIGSSGTDYNQRACVANVRVKDPKPVAYQRMLPTGPVAILPLYNDIVNVVWSLDDKYAPVVTQATDAEYVQYLNEALHADASHFSEFTNASEESTALPPPQSPSDFVNSIVDFTKQMLPLPSSPMWSTPVPKVVQGILQHVKTPPSPQTVSTNNTNTNATTTSFGKQITVLEVVGKRAGFPLRYITSDKYVASRVALIGDAAHVVHPLAGQGVNLGFGDVDALIRTISYALLTGSDIGNQFVLSKYEHEQKLTNATTLTGVDAIHKAFKLTSGPLATMRSVGMVLFNASNTLKQTAAEVAMGIKTKK